MVSIPETMALVHQPNPKSQSLTYLPSHPVPKLASPNDHLVKLHATSPCRHELTWEAKDPHIFPNGRELPRVPCYDGSGTVVLGPKDSPFKEGDDVFFWVGSDRSGCLAEYTVVKAEEMVALPQGVSFEDAAAAPLSAVTAWQGLFNHGMLVPPEGVSRNKDKTVLVTGATGGVGSWAVQLARLSGATVVTTASPSKTQLATSLGAHHVLNYNNLQEEMSVWEDKVDLILDTAGGDTLAQCWRAVKPDTGYILSVSSETPDERKPEGLLKVVGKNEWYLVNTSQDGLAAIAGFMKEGKIKSLVDSIFEMSEYEAAFAKVEGGHCTGKVVIRTLV